MNYLLSVNTTDFEKTTIQAHSALSQCWSPEDDGDTGAAQHRTLSHVPTPDFYRGLTDMRIDGYYV